MSKYDELKTKLVQYMSIEAMSLDIWRILVVKQLKENIKSENFEFSAWWFWFTNNYKKIKSC
nr:hypothetical protein [Mycoplasmopsis bovis]